MKQTKDVGTFKSTDMNRNEKALEILFQRDIDSHIEHNWLYVTINGYDLELSEDEIIYLAMQYDQQKERDSIKIPHKRK